MEIFKKRRVQFGWKIPFVDTDYGRTECMDGDKNCPDNNYRSVKRLTLSKKKPVQDWQWLTNRQKLSSKLFQISLWRRLIKYLLTKPS